jgi:hypothetical protein
MSSILKKRISTTTYSYELVSGTKRTIINDRKDITEPGNSDYYRWEWHNFFKDKLHKGETIYYEICGWDSTGGTIMGSHDIQLLKKRKELPQHFANQMVFSYGAKENSNVIFVYRITMETEDHLIEYSFEQIKGRCKELGVNPIREIYYIYCPVISSSEIKRWVDSCIVENNQSYLDNHLIEGVVVRIETEGQMKVYKDKNFLFKLIEGIIKTDDTYVDTEEVN